MKETTEFKFGLILWSPMYAFSTQQQAWIHRARNPVISNPKISPIKKYLLQNEKKKNFFKVRESYVFNYKPWYNKVCIFAFLPRKKIYNYLIYLSI